MPLLCVTGALLIFGLAVLASASAALSVQYYGHPWGFVLRQLTLGAGIGGILFLIGLRIPYRLWKPFALPLFLGAVMALLLVFIPGIGFEAQGAARWISLGEFHVQPGEFAKFALVVYLAAWLSGTRNAYAASFQEGVAPFLVIVGILGALLIMQPDVTTLGILSLTAVAVYFAARTPLWHTAFFFVLGGSLLLALTHLAQYRMNRILAFLNPALDPQGIGYQINQAMLAIGSGGLWGRGLGFSRQKFFYLPESMGDSIFAIMAEEIGFIGAVSLLLLFCFFAIRGFLIARRAPDDFGKLLAIGLTSWILVQVILNIAGNLRLAPLVGITLPFVSYGSSSLAVTLLSVGVLLNISRYTKAVKSKL